MSRGGGKVNKDWLDVDFLSSSAVTGEMLPYDTSSFITIKEKIDSISIESGTKREIEYFNLYITDINNKYILLSKESLDNKINFTIIGGPSQKYGVDFILKFENIISWSSIDCTIGLETLLRVGDILQIEYSTLQ